MESGQVEILSPAGSLAILKGAFAAGADAVYAGGSCFGARAFAQNFTEDEMLEGIDYAHLHGGSCISQSIRLSKKRSSGSSTAICCRFTGRGLDAVIVQDMGVMEFVRREFPGLAIHASTQMTVTGARSAGLSRTAGSDAGGAGQGAFSCGDTQDPTGRRIWRSSASCTGRSATATRGDAL